jgi:hypothetical protein
MSPVRLLTTNRGKVFDTKQNLHPAFWTYSCLEPLQADIDVVFIFEGDKHVKFPKQYVMARLAMNPQSNR